MKDGCDLMRKGMKAFAAVLAVATASTMSLTAFAAPSVSVSTSYSGDNVTVTANVTGVATSEQVAFLVHKAGETPSNESIYYIDQKQADQSGAVTFSFTDSKDKIVNATGSTVKVGTTSTANSTDTTDTTTLKVNDYTVTYSSTGDGTVYAVTSAGATTGENASATVSGGTAYFAISANVGYKLASYKIDNGEPVTEITVNADNLLAVTINSNCSIEFTFEVDTSEAPTPTVESTNSTVNYGSETSDNSMFTYGKASGAIKEAGMFIATSEDALTSQKSSANGSLITTGLADGTRIGKFQALGFGSDGSFAISLLEDMTDSSKTTDYKAFITSGTMYAMTYVVKSDGSVVYGDIVTIGTTTSEGND